MTKQQLHTHRAVTPHDKPKPFTSGLFEYKCRNCEATLPDIYNILNDPKILPVLCPVCHEVMDWTPIRRQT